MGMDGVSIKVKNQPVSHSGSWVGFRNYVFRNLDTGVDIVMFSNSGGALDKNWFREVMKRINKTILNY